MKKAVTSATITLILVVVLVLVLFPVATRLYAFVQQRSDDELCQMSVIKHASIKDATGIDSEINCPRKSIEFHDNYAEIDGKKQAVYEKKGDKTKAYEYESIDSYIVNQVLARELYNCFVKMGAGELDVFSGDSVLKDKNICIICSHVSFDLEQQESFSGLHEYLETESVAEGENTYMNHLNRMQRSDPRALNMRLPWLRWIKEKEENTLQLMELAFSSEEEYLVYFNGFVPTKANQALGAYAREYYVYIDTPENVGFNCDYLYN